MADRATCRGCGKPILWVVNENGKKECFDARPARALRLKGEKSVFVGNAFHGETLFANGENISQAHLPHFVTCEKAHKFRKSSK